MGVLSTKKPELLPVVGITGGIGSGKSLVSAMFSSMNVPTFNADEVAKGLYPSDLELRKWVVDQFGTDCGRWKEGKLVDVNRAALARIVFDDSSALALLNAQIHPRVGTAFSHWHSAQSTNQQSPFVLREAAILLESDSYRDCHAVIAVEAPIALRAQRAAVRLGISVHEVENRIRMQWTDEERRKKADFILHNAPEDALLNQVIQVHNQICESIGKDIRFDS